MVEYIKMPANYDMLVSHSPPVFSHSPPTGFLSEYNSGYGKVYDPLRGFCRPQVMPTTPPQLRKALNLKMQVTSPKRSCLSTKTKSATPTEIKTDLNVKIDSHTHTKKKVVFADDKGLSLTEVRVMSEPSSCPPLWSLQFLAHITQGLVSPMPRPDQWTIDFRQPASDYLDFRRRLDKEKVSLENVIVRENESLVMGTVKVRNLSFHKEVVVRATWDNWTSQEDIFCTYSQFPHFGTASGAYVLYDTFSFKITLPPSSKKLEFCVCFRCDDKEYWDNNGGLNYSLSKRDAMRIEDNTLLALRNKILGNNRETLPIPLPKYPDASQAAKVASWSEFASWNHLENNCPYW